MRVCPNAAPAHFAHMSQISYFASLPEKGQPHIATETWTLTDFLNAVRFEKWGKLIEHIRSEEDKKKRDNYKRALPSVTISGTFTERKESLLIAHSGFIAIDIDGFTDRTALLADPYTYALFSSVSGRGLVAIIKITPEKHKESFNWIANYYHTTYGIAVDRAPQNVASLRYVSSDSQIYINDKARKSGTKSEQRSAPASLPIVLPEGVAAEMCAEANRLGIDIAPTYAEYFKLGCAIAAGFGESGRSMFHVLCQPSAKYISSQADRQFNVCLKSASKGITVGTLYWMLKQHGIHPPKSEINHRAVQVAALGKRAGRSAEAIAVQLSELEGVPEPQARALADEVMRRDDIDLKRVSGSPESLIEGVMEFIKTNHPIRKNAITSRLEENGSDVSKERLNTIYLRVLCAFDDKAVTFDLVSRVIFSDFTPEFNPIKDYIDRNRYRNSTGNIEALISTIRTDTDGASTFIRRWCIGWIAAIDGHPVRSVLTLVGGQNTGKTEWFRRLPPGALKRYYAESKLDAGKDDEILMCQKLWVMDDEMGGKSKQDEKKFKELTSKSTFTLRAPYGAHNEDYKRLAVLCGTSNDEQVLSDPTGNTRILPIKVSSINHEAYNAIDKDELFMECVRAYESGEPWQLTRDELATLNSLSAQFETTPYERELILQFFRPASSGGGYVEHLTSTQIKEVIEANTRQRIMAMKRFGAELVAMFGQAKQVRKNGIVAKMYPVIRISGNSEVTPQTVDNEDALPF